MSCKFIRTWGVLVLYKQEGSSIYIQQIWHYHLEHHSSLGNYTRRVMFEHPLSDDIWGVVQEMFSHVLDPVFCVDRPAFIDVRVQ